MSCLGSCRYVDFFFFVFAWTDVKVVPNNRCVWMQQVPTEDWGETEIEMLLSQAFVLSTLFGGSDAHSTNALTVGINHNTKNVRPRRVRGR